jgi:hypothetical protein
MNKSVTTKAVEDGTDDRDHCSKCGREIVPAYESGGWQHVWGEMEEKNFKDLAAKGCFNCATPAAKLPKPSAPACAHDAGFDYVDPGPLSDDIILKTCKKCKQDVPPPAPAPATGESKPPLPDGEELLPPLDVISADYEYERIKRVANDLRWDSKMDAQNAINIATNESASTKCRERQLKAALAEIKRLSRPVPTPPSMSTGESATDALIARYQKALADPSTSVRDARGLSVNIQALQKLKKRMAGEDPSLSTGDAADAEGRALPPHCEFCGQWMFRKEVQVRYEANRLASKPSLSPEMEQLCRMLRSKAEWAVRSMEKPCDYKWPRNEMVALPPYYHLRTYICEASPENILKLLDHFEGR